MELEISTEQFDSINEEITKLEDTLPFLLEKDDNWNYVGTKERIDELKEIIKTETITI